MLAAAEEQLTRNPGLYHLAGIGFAGSRCGAFRMPCTSNCRATKSFPCWLACIADANRQGGQVDHGDFIDFLPD
ncbi:hypothetical protein [Rhodoferax sp.]|uniref:hypothetical protein n=1 Tax=Rhodoferax sp. TaxID=50421 RepID=UPI002717D766|nr:hypothetical protein [Rhodoferax sp.]MDO9195634.1 hypothetical protein [Rhodoferax sp.]